MLDRTRLEQAVDLQRRTYGLLRWLDSAVARGFILPETAHEYASLPSEAAAKWLEVHYHNLPPDLRPATRSPEAIRPFSNMLASYLVVSFEYDTRPDDDRVHKGNCFCPICSYLLLGPRLRTKKLTPADKRRARKLTLQCLSQIALESGVALDPARAKKLVDRREISEAAAMVAYGVELVRRMEGHIEGPAVLALWRHFAWTPTGAPKKNFTLEASAVLESEACLKSGLLDADPPDRTPSP